MNERKTAISIFSLVIAFLILSTVVVSNVFAQNPKLEAQRKAQIAKARKTLEGTTWVVYTTLQDTRRAEKGQETFAFTKRRVTTQNLAAQGYAPDGSNYSARIETDGTIVWETMQKKYSEEGEEQGEALLRGDLRGRVMTGVIDIQPSRGARKIYYFTSSKEKPKAAVTQTTTPTTTTTTTTTTKTKKPEKKRRGWW